MLTGLYLHILGVAFSLLMTTANGVTQFASMFGDHMVLQRGPQRASIWGYADVIGDHVIVRMNGVLIGEAPVIQSNNSHAVGEWKLQLLPESHPGPYSITVTSSEGSATINDVMFGDVWLCSGQSNMQFEMKKVNNSLKEIEDALKYTDIRMLFTKLSTSDTPQTDAQLRFPWTKPVKGILEEFSALCFMYGRDIQPTLNYPIGLILSSWGGTAIEVWSPPEALTHCALGNSVGKNSTYHIPNLPSVLWNSMINPFLPMTIKGAIWYQGESNSGQWDLYACQFPAMINAWRNIFHSQSGGETDIDFPFGFVQLAAFRPAERVSAITYLRWAQTVNVGYVPNVHMKNTFMAVAVDLPDFKSPYGNIHPRYKQEVAERLALGGLAVAYGNQSVVFQGPFPTQYRLKEPQHILAITFDDGTANLRQNNANGFDACCSANATDVCSYNHVHWLAAPITSNTGSAVELDVSACQGMHVAGVRYLWRESPCALLQCALYSQDSSLPVPQFMKTGGFGTHLDPGVIG